MLTSLVLMHGGELFVPKIKSMSIRGPGPGDGAAAAASHRRHQAGREAARGADRRRSTRASTLDLGHCYVIEPTLFESVLQGPCRVPASRWGRFPYGSDNNPDWLDADGLAAMLRLLQMNDDPAFIPYGRQQIERADIDAVVEALNSAWLTTGPRVAQFEHRSRASAVRARRSRSAAAPRRCTRPCTRSISAPVREVIVPAMTFAGDRECGRISGWHAGLRRRRSRYAAARSGRGRRQGDRPHQSRRGGRLLGGQPADYDAIETIASAAAWRSWPTPATRRARPTRAVRSARSPICSTFSFHPVKHFTTCEGGMITARSRDHAERMRRFPKSRHRQRSPGEGRGRNIRV